MALDQALASAMASIPECLAGGYIDMSSGMLLALKTVDSHPREVMDLLAAATTDLFNGNNVTVIENIFKKARGRPNDAHHYFQEIVINSDNLVHVFLRGKKNEEHVVAFVCRKSANLGMVLTKARMTLEVLEKEV